MTEERPTTKYIQLKLAKQTKKYSYHSQLMNGRSLDLLLLSTKSSGVTLQMKAPERYLLILLYSASHNIIKVGIFVLILTCPILGLTRLKKRKKGIDYQLNF